MIMSCFLLEIIGWWGRADGYLALVPVPVVLQRVQDVLGVGVHEVGPGLPQRVHDVVDEANLEQERLHSVQSAGRFVTLVLSTVSVKLQVHGLEPWLWGGGGLFKHYTWDFSIVVIYTR